MTPMLHMSVLKSGDLHKHTRTHTDITYTHQHEECTHTQTSHIHINTIHINTRGFTVLMDMSRVHTREEGIRSACGRIDSVVRTNQSNQMNQSNRISRWRWRWRTYRSRRRRERKSRTTGDVWRMQSKEINGEKQAGEKIQRPLQFK